MSRMEFGEQAATLRETHSGLFFEHGFRIAQKIANAARSPTNWLKSVNLFVVAHDRRILPAKELALLFARLRSYCTSKSQLKTNAQTD
jgi:hypothetical protein